jgi:predicted LPLAT superfamily acyltransferase
MRACVVVPVYNHKDAVGATVTALTRHGLPIYLVDDGSDAATRACLAELAARQPSVRLLRLETNQGKGAAVMRGLSQAHEDGYTHALQVDADGQHEIDDVPKFLDAAAAAPTAMICGQPIFDDSVPKVRLYGRYLTHVLVWLQTLSFALKDSMCGFRLYPLAQTYALMRHAWIPPRMDFDTVIAVRLIWAGCPVVNLPTPVRYPRDGVSHFRMVRDNARLSFAHARLLAGMLWRLPLLLWRKLTPRPPGRLRHWSRLNERGSYWGLLFVFYTYRFLGHTAARLLLYPVTAYFFLTGRRARLASMQYLRRLYEHAGSTVDMPRPPTLADSWRHMLAFADSNLDKLAAWCGRADQVDFPDRDRLDALIASGRGGLLIGAHLGNWEMARVNALSRGHKTINAVVYTDNARRFNRMLTFASERFRFNLISISDIGPETAMMLQEKIDRGEFLVITGDRTPPSENGRVVKASFLGREAAFAQGPFVLAALLGCPVHLFFCLREAGRYRVHLEPFCERVLLPRGQRVEAIARYAQDYARRLEHYCAVAPHQWFNFYDFWRDADGIAAETTTKGAALS